MNADRRWADPDEGPGGPPTLRALHEIVPAAEELDVLDDVKQARERAHWAALFDEVRWPDDEPEEQVAGEDITRERIVRLLESKLGAQVIAEFRTDHR